MDLQALGSLMVPSEQNSMKAEGDNTAAGNISREVSGLGGSRELRSLGRAWRGKVLVTGGRGSTSLGGPVGSTA